MRIAMGHLESAKCIGGLNATLPLISPKLYHLILPYPFKPSWIILHKTPRGRCTTHSVAGRLRKTQRVLFVTRGEVAGTCPKQDESPGDAHAISECRS